VTRFAAHATTTRRKQRLALFEIGLKNEPPSDDTTTYCGPKTAKPPA
jgi:hypothetical protein